MNVSGVTCGVAVLVVVLTSVIFLYLLGSGLGDLTRVGLHQLDIKKGGFK